MKILLITPYPHKHITFEKIAFSPLTLKQLKAITPKKHHVIIINEKFKKINFNEHFDVVGISCMTFNVFRGYEIADEFRRRGIPVVLGGYHPTALPNEAIKHADSVVIGEAEITWPLLLSDLEQGKLRNFYKTTELVKPELIPPADHTNEDYSNSVESIQASRGCPVGCKFCSIRNIEGSVLRTRKISEIIEEIKSISAKNIFFADSSLTINPTFTKNLFKELKHVNKKFDCFGNINVLSKDEELLKLSSEAGCKRWLIGFETFSQKNIEDIGKKSNNVTKYIQAVKKIKDYNVMVTGMFMFGFDSDTKEVFNSTLEAIIELNLDNVYFNILTPYPGTLVYDKLEREGRILSKNWSNYLSRCMDQKVNFQPKNMTAEELINGITRLAKKYYSTKNIVKNLYKSDNLSFNNLVLKLRNNIISKLHYNNLIRF